MDLFSHQDRPARRNIGHGNALFLADIAQGATLAQLRANRDAGKYPDLHRNAKGWLIDAGLISGGN